MRNNKTLALVSAALLAGVLPAQAQDKPAYDAALAERLGADEYGMRSYVFVLLKTGPETEDDEERRAALFKGHFANMKRLADEGALVMAGPLDGKDGKRGLFVINAPSIEAAQAMVETDPAVAAGLFAPEYSGFYGSAALLELNDLHAKIQRENIE